MHLPVTAWIRWLGLVVLLAVGGSWAQPAGGPAPLRFITNASLPPVAYGADGQARGVAVDLTLAAAAAAGLDVRIEAMDWQQAQSEMAAGRADALVHINPTPERLKWLAFSAPLLESRFHLFRRVERVEIVDLASLAGRRVGVERAGFPVQFLAAHPQVKVEFVRSWEEGVERVRRGEIDALFVDRWAGDHALARTHASDVVAVEPEVARDTSRIAVARDRAELLAALDRGLAAIERDGTRAAVLKRWSGQEVLHLTRQSVQRSLLLLAGLLGGGLLLLALAYLRRLRQLNLDLAASRDAKDAAWREAETANTGLQDAFDEVNALYNGSPVGLHSLDADGLIVRINDTELRWLGLAREDVVGRLHITELLAPGSRQVFHDRFPLFKRQGELHDLRLELLRDDGSTFPVVVNAKAVVDADGRFVMSRSTVQDISTVVRAQTQMDLAQRIGHVGSWDIDLVSGAITWSAEMRRLFDVPDDRALSVDAVLQTVHPDDRAWVFTRYQVACSGGQALHLRCRIVHRDGQVRHVEMSGECRCDAQGRAIGMVGYARDLTAEVRSAEQLALSEERYRAVVESQSELICRFRADGRLLLANSRFCETFGLDADTLERMTWRTLAVPEDRPMVEERLRELSPQSAVVVIENRVQTATRGVRWMEFVNRAFFDDEGRLRELQTVGRDVHDRKLLEEQLDQALQMRQAMLENDLVGIVTTRDRHIVWANPAFEHMMGCGPRELEGACTRTAYPSDAAYTAFGAQAYPLLSQGNRFMGRIEYVRKDGQAIWADVSGAPLPRSDLTLWVFVEVTARKLAEDELQRHRDHLQVLVDERTAELTAALELAQSANRAKNAFLAMVSHELRTPLNAILGLTPIIRARSTDAGSLDLLSKVEGAGEQLLDLISDLLDSTRIEANRLRIDSVPFRLSEVMARVDTTCADRARVKGLPIDVVADAEVLAHVFVGDPLRIEQMINNLVGNAIKFSEHGSIVIRLTATPEPGAPTRLRVEVIDQGEGIAADDQQRIFMLFEQVDASSTRRHGGAGLGLGLCKRLAELMGGRIGVRSQPGQGSCFWFELPLSDAPTPAAP